MRSLRLWRVLSLLALLLGIAAGALGYVLPAVQRGTLRGTLDTYPPPMRGAEQLLFGTNVALEQYDPATLDARLSLLAARGIKTVRQHFRWSEIEPRKGEWNWQRSDAIFAALRKHNLRVLPVLLGTPDWARGPSGNASQPAIVTAPPRDVTDFARFAAAFAARYDAPQPGPLSPGQIAGYQIWDEPNLSAGWGNAVVNPRGYLDLLRAAGDSIRGINPLARIVLAGLAPTAEWTDANQPPQVFLAALYDLGGADAFDVAAAKPYGFDFSPYDRRVEFATLNFSHVILIYETMATKGDTRKALWLTAGGWNALPDSFAEKKTIWGQVKADEQMRFVREAAQRTAREWYWAGALFLQELEPINAPPEDPRWGFALMDAQGQPRPLLDAMSEAARSSSAAARGQLFAVCDLAQPGARVAPPVDCYHANASATFSGGWRFGELGADAPEVPDASDTSSLDDDPRVSFEFAGDSLALELRRGDYRANAFVWVDGAPANALPREPRGAFVPMWSPDLKPRIERIEVARNLPPGPHTATLVLERGWNQWALMGWSSQSPETRIMSRDYSWLRGLAFVFCVMGLCAFLYALRRARWRMGFAELGIAPAAIGTALLLWGAAAITWAQDASFAFRNLGAPAAYALGTLASATWIWAPIFAFSVVGLGVLFALVLARLDVGLALLAFFIPFFLLPQRVFAYSFSMVEVLTVLCLCSCLLSAWRSRSQAGRSALIVRHFGLLDLGLLLLVLLSLISSVYARQQVEAWREFRMVIAEPALVYAMLRLAPLTTAQRNRILLGLVMGGLAVAGLGLINYVRGNVFPAEFGIPRIRSVYGSPNNDALYMGRIFAVLFPVAITSAVWTRARGQRVAAWAGLCMVALAMALSQSRGALLLGLPICVIVVCIVAGGRWRMLGWLGLIGLVVGMALLASGTGARLFAGTRLMNALDLSRGTGFIRINLWQSAWRMWMDHLWLGVGPDNFLYAYRSAYILPAAWQEPNLSHPHNVLLDFASKLGIGGVAVLAVQVIGVVRVIMRGLRSSAARLPALIALAVLAYTLGHGLVDHAFFLVDLAFAWAVVMGISAAQAPARSKN